MLTSVFLTADLAVLGVLNAPLGHSWLFDYVVAAALDDPVVKAGPLGACFIFAWLAAGERSTLLARRRILLVTLLSLFVIAPAGKILFADWLSPRPFVMAQDIYLFRDGRLEHEPAVDIRTLQTGTVHDSIEAVRSGTLHANDLASFPSDHAALYFALALGIFLASRMAGVVALAWTLLVIFIPRIAVGLHWTTDMLAGAVGGAAIMLALQLAASRLARRPLEGALAWADRRPALTVAMLFLLLFEIVATMPTLERAREAAAGLAERFL